MLLHHPTCDNVTKTWYYFERCEALGMLQRIHDRMQHDTTWRDWDWSVTSKINVLTMIDICMSQIQAEIVFYAATHKEKHGNQTEG